MLLRQAFLLLFGLCAGGVIAAGVFAFLAMIGVFPRLIGKTKTKNHVLLYETWIIIGGILGNAVDLFAFPTLMGSGASEGLQFFGTAFLAVLGCAIGIFVGCLVMSLAETVKTVPVMNRRIRLAVGIQYVILGIAVGKFLGASFYFMRGMGA